LPHGFDHFVLVHDEFHFFSSDVFRPSLNFSQGALNRLKPGQLGPGLLIVKIGPVFLQLGLDHMLDLLVKLHLLAVFGDYPGGVRIRLPELL
jgi:hypothetical protein